MGLSAATRLSRRGRSATVDTMKRSVLRVVVILELQRLALLSHMSLWLNSTFKLRWTARGTPWVASWKQEFSAPLVLGLVAMTSALSFPSPTTRSARRSRSLWRFSTIITHDPLKIKDCTDVSYCNGRTALCPKADTKEDNVTECNGGTQVLLKTLSLRAW